MGHLPDHTTFGKVQGYTEHTPEFQMIHDRAPMISYQK